MLLRKQRSRGCMMYDEVAGNPHTWQPPTWGYLKNEVADRGAPAARLLDWMNDHVGRLQGRSALCSPGSSLLKGGGPTPRCVCAPCSARPRAAGWPLWWRSSSSSGPCGWPAPGRPPPAASGSRSPARLPASPSCKRGPLDQSRASRIFGLQSD